MSVLEEIRRRRHQLDVERGAFDPGHSRDQELRDAIEAYVDDHPGCSVEDVSDGVELAYSWASQLVKEIRDEGRIQAEWTGASPRGGSKLKLFVAEGCP